MTEPKLHPKGAGPNKVNARDIAAATGFRIQAVLGMLARRDNVKREPTIWTRVTGKKLVSMSGGGQTHQDVYEEYQAFPGLEWDYRTTDAWADIPQFEGLEIIRRCRAYRRAHELYVPRLREWFFQDEPEPTREVTRVEDVDTTVVQMRFQRGYADGWYFAYQAPGTGYRFLSRRNGKVFVITPRGHVRSWGDGPALARKPSEGDEWNLMLNGENVILRWIGSRWETPDALDAGTLAKIVTHRRGAA